MRRVSLAFALLRLTILVSCLGCSGPIYRVGLPATETIAAIRDLKAVEDPSHWYAYYADEKTLREASCSYLPSSGYKATIRGQKYCNFVTDDSIVLDYSGSTKEGFMKVCLEKDPPINYFSFNDVLPLAQGMAEEANAFYRTADYPTGVYQFDVKMDSASYASFLSFGKSHFPKQQYESVERCDSFGVTVWTYTEGSANLIFSASSHSKNVFDLVVEP